MENRKNKKWSSSERQFVIANYGSMAIKIIAEHICRSEDSIRQFATANLLTNSAAEPWTKKELKSLATMYYSGTGYKAISIALERSERSVANKISELRIPDRMISKVDISVIDSDKPFNSGKLGQYRMLLEAMNIGDSFEYPKYERQTIQNAFKYLPERLFSTKSETETTRRVWRIL